MDQDCKKKFAIIFTKVRIVLIEQEIIGLFDDLLWLLCVVVLCPR